MSEYEIDQRIKDLIGAHVLGGGWSISQAAEYHDLAARRGRMMRPKRSLRADFLYRGRPGVFGRFLRV